MSNGNKPHDWRVLNVIERISSAVGRADFHLISAAKLVGVSAPRLRRIFRAQTGLSLAQYALEARVRRAEELLLSTQLSVKEIASQIGYTASSNFNRDFRRARKITPLQFRAYARSGVPRPRGE